MSRPPDIELASPHPPPAPREDDTAPLTAASGTSRVRGAAVAGILVVTLVGISAVGGAIYWHGGSSSATDDDTLSAEAAQVRALKNAPAEAIPDGVSCTETTVCSENGYCSTVCARGTVEVASWLSGALSAQRELQASGSVCDAQLPATHNSAITLADGYGNEDQAWDLLVEWLFADQVPWATVRTNNQYLSLTDQLELGVRLLEIDAHYFLEALRVGHCGGLEGNADVDEVLEALNEFAEQLGLTLHWDLTTVGCVPSLSGIPDAEQRTLADALAEVAAWLEANPGEFVALFLDVDADLDAALLAEVVEGALGDLALAADAFSADSTVQQLVDAGTRALVLADEDLGTVLYAPDVCAFQAVPVTSACADVGVGVGDWARVFWSELQYGPYDAQVNYTAAEARVTAETIPEWQACGVSSPAPDLLTPARMEGFVWSWAEGEDLSGADCISVSASDGRWHACSSTTGLPLACRSSTTSSWSVAATACPDGSAAATPINAVDAAALVAALEAAGEGEAVLG